MSIRDSKLRFSGFQAIASGVDSGRSPSVLDPSTLSWAVNATMRDGFVTCRPGWSEIDLTFKGADGTPDTTVQTAFESGGRFQGASPYLAGNGLSYLVTLIGGRVFLLDVQSRNVQDLSSGGLTLSSTAPQVWFTQAEKFLIIQNGEDAALIYDGATLRKSQWPNVQEVPTGTVMAYNNGRLWVSVSPTDGSQPGQTFVAGDLAYSVTGNVDDLLGFTENIYLNGGGSFTIPMQAGRITAMRSIAVQDNPTGQGPLIIFTTRGAFSVNAPFNRDDWQNTTSPIVTIALLAAGATAQESTVLVNGDIWFRSPDGIRSFVYAQRDHGTWVNTPLSREVCRALDTDSQGLLDHASAIHFDNRLLCTTQPYQVMSGASVRGIAHRGLVALDFSPVSRMFNRAQPSWEGVWTGLSILQALVTDSAPQRAYLFAFDSTLKVTLWEVSYAARFDNTSTRIEWALETPSYGFDTAGWNLRELRWGDFWANRIFGQVDFTFEYRPDNAQEWTSWTTARICAATEVCTPAACATPSTVQEQYRNRVRLPLPPATCSSIPGTPLNRAYRYALRVEVEGFCALPQFRLAAGDLDEDVDGSCPATSCTLNALAACPVDDYTYSIT